MTPKTRRGRTLSPEERALWEQVAASTKPLHKRKIQPAEVSASALPAPAQDQPAAALPQSATAMRAPKSKEPRLPSLAPIEKRHLQRLARGTGTIDARIDLHGLTQAEAHVRLGGFLRMAQARDHRLVLVITGKGGFEEGFSPQGRGILRRVVPQWLALPEFRALVVGFEEAHRGHGGAGALYVRIRRKKGKDAP
ncbi:Smr/MutS family protein [Stappia sp. F7233]|uniref:Smr/MutS family protein n=1 Tax=Stappia albiluteola TaxID=2758565 RepID=A0A839AGH5_9HYPH|nr:Smr/MutS family protein [Stappia albiluteola]MBA5778803.1 Smr/MutS family protein [Stappia albiluteola]